MLSSIGSLEILWIFIQLSCHREKKSQTNLIYPLVGVFCVFNPSPKAYVQSIISIRPLYKEDYYVVSRTAFFKFYNITNMAIILLFI